MNTLQMTREQEELTNRYLETRGCKIKMSIPTRKQARKIAREASLRYKSRLSAYKCKYCPDFHIGHNKYSERTKEN